MAQNHLNCMMSNRTQIVRTQTTQRWRCTHCSQKPVADSQDNQMAPVFDKKNPCAHQHQLRIHPWNGNGIHRELPLQEDLPGGTNVCVVSIQETKRQPTDKTPELRNFSAVQRERPVQGKREGEALSENIFPTKSANHRSTNQVRWRDYGDIH